MEQIIAGISWCKSGDGENSSGDLCVGNCSGSSTQKGIYSACSLRQNRLRKDTLLLETGNSRLLPVEMFGSSPQYI